MSNKRSPASPYTPQAIAQRAARDLQREELRREASPPLAAMAAEGQPAAIAELAKNINAQLEQIRVQTTKSSEDTNGILKSINDILGRQEQRFDQFAGRVEGLENQVQQLMAEKGRREQRDKELDEALAKIQVHHAVKEQALHENRLLALVPEEHVPELRSIITSVVKEERPGADYSFSISPRQPKQEARGAAAQAAAAGASAQGARRGDRPLRRLVDIRVLPEDRRALATLGGVLNRKYGIAVMDALTRHGRELKNQRLATYIKLRDVDKLNPRWSRGVDITVERNGRRVPFEGPWIPSDPRGAGSGDGAARGGSDHDMR
ncbi:hypothetical protein PLESTB_001725300 [Pleodorina starrii]|uniref:Uncharacterized protein n=1 Tax=Pleodorina starrii TaxID=330485 RepID=A0A9W6C0I7_9CHLO|nr:hypothetical protein PLESTB_001725300 [Pleodorina starrii]GLC69949.1 hypothetical protein PLESTF_000902700 [Pleodorina starrii]